MKVQYEQIENYIAGSKIMRKKAEELINKNSVGLITQIESNKYKALIVDGEEEYIITIDVKDVEASKCGCSTNINFKRCHHVLAFLVDLQKYLESDKRQNLSPDQLIANEFTNYFNYADKQFKVVNLRPKFLISEENNLSKMSLVIKYEGVREYKVENIATIIDCLDNKKEFDISKKMKLVKNEYSVNGQTQKIIDIVKLNKNYIHALKNSLLLPEIELSSIEIIEILKSLEGQLVDINFNEFKLSPPPINQIISIKKIENKIDIGSKINHKMQEIIPNKLIKSYDEFFILDSKQGELFSILKKIDNRNIKSLQVPLKYYEKFMIKSKTSVEKLFLIENDEDFNRELEDKELTINIYIKKYSKSKIIIKVEFSYEGICYGVDGYSTSGELIFINRDFESEQKILDLLPISTYDLIETNSELGFLMTKSHKQTYDFLTKIAPKLEKYANVFIDEEVSSKIININNKNLSVNFEQTNEIDFFDFKYELSDFTREEIKDILNIFKNNENFYVHNNEKYITFDDSQVANQLKFINKIEDELINGCNNIPFYRYVSLKQMADNLFENINIDDMLENKLEQIKKIEIKTNKLQNVVVRDYQKIGMNWLEQLNHFQLGGILADEMGLGKTLQLIGFLSFNSNAKSLIVVPKALLFNWAQELTKYAPTMKFSIVNGTKMERTKIILENENNIIITSYNMLRLDIDLYDNEFDFCIIDEAQTIKNPSAKVTKALKKVNAKIKFALTGTPLENNLLDLWSIVDFINPHYFGTQSNFKEKFVNSNNIDILKFHLSPILLRRQKKDVLSELPEKIENPVFCELTPKQKIVYASYVKKYHKQLLSLIEEENVNTNKLEILTLLTRLRQIACHPKLFIDTYDGSSGKIELLLELVKENIETNNKVLIFSQFTSFLKLVASDFEKNDISYFYMDGKTKAENRINLVETFNNDQTEVFLISLKAGGVGLNLTSASSVIHLDPWWNPQVESQATDRAHRIGQKRVVQVSKLITKETIEEKIYLLQQEKKQLTDDILNLDNKMLSTLNMNEIVELFTID